MEYGFIDQQKCQYFVTIWNLYLLSLNDVLYHIISPELYSRKGRDRFTKNWRATYWPLQYRKSTGWKSYGKVSICSNMEQRVQKSKIAGAGNWCSRTYGDGAVYELARDVCRRRKVFNIFEIICGRSSEHAGKHTQETYVHSI